MSAATNASAYASQSGPRKRGGQADAVTNHLSVVPHTSVCGLPGNTNAFELSGHKPHQRSAKRRTVLEHSGVVTSFAFHLSAFTFQLSAICWAGTNPASFSRGLLAP